MTSESDTDSPSDEAREWSWEKAEFLYVFIILVASLVLINITYKIVGTILGRRHGRNQEHGLVELAQTALRGELEVTRADIQRPLRALTRSSSEVSVLPRYGLDQGELCDRHVEVEKRGKYSYVVAHYWPGGGKTGK
jgi:hypothetical protein